MLLENEDQQCASMTEYAIAIRLLIDTLDVLIDERENSSRSEGFRPIGPIEDDYPELYEAIQRVESLTGGKLPMGAWEHSDELLELASEMGDDPRRSRRACVEAECLRAWARAQVNTGDSIEGRFLKIEFDVANLAIRRKGKRAEFGNKTRAWSLFCHLHAAGAAGRPRNGLLKAVWPDGDVVDNNLDQQKREVDKLIEDLGIEIQCDNRGIWRLVEIGL